MRAPRTIASPGSLLASKGVLRSRELRVVVQNKEIVPAETLLQRVVVGRVNDAAAVNCTMLTLIPFPGQLTRREWDMRPSFDGPARVVGIRSVDVARDFAKHGPVETEKGWWTHGRARLLW